MTSESAVEVGSLVLPAMLVQAIRAGRWVPPKDPEPLRRIFGDEPDGPMFYDLRAIVRQNASFQASSPADVYGEISPTSIGILPGRAVLIGDLGADMPIALDYRASLTAPTVIYLGPAGWVQVAPDIGRLLDQLGE